MSEAAGQPAAERGLALAAQVAIGLALALFIIWQGARWTYQNGLDELAGESRAQLDLYVAYLRGVLNKYETLPELLATDQRLLHALRDPHDAQRIDSLNRHLASISRISDASDIYLMDAGGNTIAASNWDSDYSFIGRNFAFRPYFQQALQGGLGRYYALGTTSKQRGYYFAYPVRANGRVAAVVVVKIGVETMEREWGHSLHAFVVTDPDGVVFISTNPDWLFHTLGSLDTTTRQRILASRRYPDAPLRPLPVERHPIASTGDLVVFDDSLATIGSRRHLDISQSMRAAGWDVHVLTDTRRLAEQTLAIVALITAGIGVLFMTTVLLWQRRRAQVERIDTEHRAKLALEQANRDLESRISERTRDLSDANLRLRNEVEEHRNTEAALRRTQSELVQAAKLATLGQMSAGINHELNQPLAAIRAYADNGQALLEKGRMKELRWNLEQIADLTERMSRIGAQLKIFARKSSGTIEQVAVAGVINAALAIVAPQVRRTGARVELKLADDRLQVAADEILLQQVMVNLLSNALQAVADEIERVVRITAQDDGTRLSIRVEDSGCGFDEADAQRLFEPFFTTKGPGEGLGLGLSIAQRILTEHHGELVPGRSALGGASFEIRLPVT